MKDQCKIGLAPLRVEGQPVEPTDLARYPYIIDQRDLYQIGDHIYVRKTRWNGAEGITSWLPATVCALGKHVVGAEYFNNGQRVMLAPEDVRKPR